MLVIRVIVAVDAVLAKCKGRDWAEQQSELFRSTQCLKIDARRNELLGVREGTRCLEKKEADRRLLGVLQRISGV